MQRIIWNNIEKEIKLRHPDSLVLQDNLRDQIEQELFLGSKTRWSRILNNSSQPTLHELILISEILKKPVENLVEYKALTPSV